MYRWAWPPRRSWRVTRSLRHRAISRLRKNAGTSSFRSAGFAREPGIQEHGPEKSMDWPVFMVSGPGPDGPSRNDTRVFQQPVRFEVSVKLGVSIRRAVPMHKDALAARGERSANVLVRVDDGISGIAVADLHIDNVASATVDQVVGVAGAGFETGAHPGTQRRLAGIGHEHGLALDNVNEFVLAHMSMAQRRHAAGRQPRQVHPETGQSEHIAEHPPFSSCDTWGERLGVAASGAGGRHSRGFDCARR